MNPSSTTVVGSGSNSANINTSSTSTNTNLNSSNVPTNNTNPNNPNFNASSNPNAAPKNKPPSKKDKKPSDDSMFRFGLGWGRTNEPMVEDKDNKEHSNPNPVSSTNVDLSRTSVEQNVMDQESTFDRQSVHSLSASQMSNGNPNMYALQNKNATQREKFELSVIKKFIESYFKIVKKNVGDTVPKSIMALLINLSKERLQQDLALVLYKEERFEDLLSENPEIAQKRTQANELLSVLRNALDIINEVGDSKAATSFDQIKE